MVVTQTKPDSGRSSKTMLDRELAITVLAGGPSGEREISLESGQAVAAALESLGHTVYLEDIAPNELSALARQVDCVFVALHGAFGEDGEVQTILEKHGLCYCGSGPDACALAINKAAAKARFADLDLPTPRFSVAQPQTIDEAMAGWNVPVVVKPIQEGSSLSCYIVRDSARFRPAVESVLGDYGECLIEEYIGGREITVSILSDSALPPIEIRTRREFYDYEAKYVDEETEFLFDIDLPQELLDQVAAMSLKAHRGLGCRDFSRVDWRIDDEQLKAFLLEVNVIPGLTSHSLFPKAAQRAGWSLPMMYQHLVEHAMSRSS